MAIFIFKLRTSRFTNTQVSGSMKLSNSENIQLFQEYREQKSLALEDLMIQIELGVTEIEMLLIKL